MSLFGANTIFKKAVARMRAEEEKKSSIASEESSHIGGLLDKITGPLTDPEGIATTSEIAHELTQMDREDQLRAFHGTAGYKGLKAGEEKDNFERGLHQA